VQGAEASGGAGVPQYVAQIEQGLGEVLRRLEKKVDSVASLLDQARGAWAGRASSVQCWQRKATQTGLHQHISSL
jgi:hypothetical protein